MWLLLKIITDIIFSLFDKLACEYLTSPIAC
nr:MAG TPA: hypothetical protein [Caudoviricetes sp.]